MIGRVAVSCGHDWRACQDLNRGPHPYQGSAPGLFAPDRTCHLRNCEPLETAGNRSAPMACGPNVDQTSGSRTVEPLSLVTNSLDNMVTKERDAVRLLSYAASRSSHG
jgi:hypothetical protein